ncbi:hypothetical protein G6F37_000765 [Rhizopus arrhizus]|nr:hypothetical protein G6F38_000237 [Rhizopus arrhizus]KAG1163922.1 hypothetical protein G6F37_000765 [Rhizopus arrhizus]
MSEWSNLPAEIQHKVFLELKDLKDISNCQLTCRNWSIIAQHRLYKRVSFCERDRDAVTRFMNCLRNTNNSEPGKLVKSLHLGELFDEMNYRRYDDYLSHLAEICPNVEELDAESPVSSFWEDLAYVTIRHWPNIRVIPVPSYSTNVVEYALSLLQIRHSLSQMLILPSFYETLEGLKFITNLKHYTNLTYLCMLDPTTPANIDDLIQDCSKLEKLEVNIVGADDDSYDLDINYSGTSKNPRPCIKELVIETSLCDDSLNYIMDKFGCLESLVLMSYGDYIDDYKSATKAKFIDHVLQLPSFHLRGSLDLFDTLVSSSHNISHIDIILNGFPYPMLSPSCDIASLEQKQIRASLHYPEETPRKKLADILKKVGSKVHKMYFSVINCTDGVLGESVDTLIENIIEHCQALKYVHYVAESLRKPKTMKKEIRNDSITGMSIKASMIMSLKHLSSWLPCLNRLKLYTVMAIGRPQKNIMKINMPYSSLNYLYLELSAYVSANKFLESKMIAQDSDQLRQSISLSPTVFLKISIVDSEEKRLVLTNPKGKAKIEECQHFEEGPMTISIYVCCRSLEKICIKVNSLCATMCLQS